MADTVSSEVLGSGTTNGNTLPYLSDGGEAREITLSSSVSIVSGQKYAITTSCQDDVYPGWAYDYPLYTTPPDYAGGNQWFSGDSGDTWVDAARGNDYYFVTKAGGVEKESYTFPPQPGGIYAAYGIEDSNLRLGQSFTATSSYDLTSVVLLLGLWVDSEAVGTITVRIREVNAKPSKAVNPTPTDTNSAVTLDHDTIVWEDGGGADTYNVYYGTTSGALSLVSSAQAGTSFTIWGVSDGSPYDYLDIRYWRIDSTNEAGTTTGDEWMFTTIPLTYPNPSPTPPDPDYPYPPDHDFNPNFINTTQRLICAANSKVWYEV